MITDFNEVIVNIFSGNVDNDSTNSSFILGDIPNSGGNFIDLPTSKDQKLSYGEAR